MDLSIEKMERLAGQAATEAELSLEVIWVACDSNLLWEITFSGRNNWIGSVLIDAHDFHNEDLVRMEIKRQILGLHFGRASLTPSSSS